MKKQSFSIILMLSCSFVLSSCRVIESQNSAESAQLNPIFARMSDQQSYANLSDRTFRQIYGSQCVFLERAFSWGPRQLIGDAPEGFGQEVFDVAGSSEGAVVVWGGGAAVNDSAVLARVLTGSALLPNWLPATTLTADMGVHLTGGPDVAMNESGAAVVTWSQMGSVCERDTEECGGIYVASRAPGVSSNWSDAELMAGPGRENPNAELAVMPRVDINDRNDIGLAWLTRNNHGQFKSKFRMLPAASNWENIENPNLGAITAPYNARVVMDESSTLGAIWSDLDGLHVARYPGPLCTLAPNDQNRSRLGYALDTSSEVGPTKSRGRASLPVTMLVREEGGQLRPGVGLIRVDFGTCQGGVLTPGSLNHSPLVPVHTASDRLPRSGFEEYGRTFLAADRLGNALITYDLWNPRNEEAGRYLTARLVTKDNIQIPGFDNGRLNSPFIIDHNPSQRDNIIHVSASNDDGSSMLMWIKNSQLRWARLVHRAYRDECPEKWEFQSSSDMPHAQNVLSVRIAPLPNGNFVSVWKESVINGRQQLYASIFRQRGR